MDQSVLKTCRRNDSSVQAEVNDLGKQKSFLTQEKVEAVLQQAEMVLASLATAPKKSMSCPPRFLVLFLLLNVIPYVKQTRGP